VYSAGYVVIPAKIIASGLELIVLYSFKLYTAMRLTMPLAALITAVEARPNPEKKE
jgi:hypothetical protein